MATLTASTCIYRQTRVAETHIELAKYQQREGKFSDAVVLATAKTMAPASWWALYGKHVPLFVEGCRMLSARPARERVRCRAQLVGVRAYHDACAEPHASPRAR